METESTIPRRVTYGTVGQVMTSRTRDKARGRQTLIVCQYLVCCQGVGVPHYLTFPNFE
jgi:hypothetical protein